MTPTRRVAYLGPAIAAVAAAFLVTACATPSDWPSKKP